MLEVEDPIRGQYVLEVSSPGIDRPLFTREHYERFSGEQVTLRTTIPLDGRRKFTGALQGMEGDNVVLVVDGAEVAIPFTHIDKAKIVPVFD